MLVSSDRVFNFYLQLTEYIRTTTLLYYEQCVTRTLGMDLHTDARCVFFFVFIYVSYYCARLSESETHFSSIHSMTLFVAYIPIL